MYAGEISDDLFKVDILTAMRLVVEAWNGVSVDTIINCWIKVRFANALPFLQSRLAMEPDFDEIMEDPQQDLQLVIEEYRDSNGLCDDAFLDAGEFMDAEDTIIKEEEPKIRDLIDEAEAENIDVRASQINDDVMRGVTDSQKLESTLRFEQTLLEEGLRISKTAEGFINNTRAKLSKKLPKSLP